MKQLLTILCLVLLVSCSKEIPEGKLVYRDGLYYEINSTKPFTGNLVRYHRNGQLWYRTKIKKGKKHGLHEEFNDNGSLDWKGNYKNNKHDGPWESFRDGQLTTIRNWKNGKQDGLVIRFNKTGSIDTKTCWKNDEIYYNYDYCRD